MSRPLQVSALRLLRTYPCTYRRGFTSCQSYLGSQPSRHQYIARKDVLFQRRFAKQASAAPYFVLAVCVVGAVGFVEYVTFEDGDKSTQEEAVALPKKSLNTGLIDFAAMPPPPGTLGNLTAEQEQRLQEFWALLFKTLGVKDPNGEEVHAETPAAPVQEEKKERRSGFFHRKKASSASQPSPGVADPEDKYGQTAELQKIIADTEPHELRDVFWSMVKRDHPDALLLRFLRARKWDIHRALAMLISTVHWRKNEMHVDDDIMKHGEGGAVIDAESSDPTTKKDGADFLAQLRMGKSFLHGIDAEGRPLCVVRVRLHRGGEQTERSLERYTVYLIETCRLVLTPPVETATIVFDMTGFTMANMDYTPVKFMIKVFEANYPESLGSVLVHKAPWIFQGIWKIIKGWLDPVVAAKVHFTNNVEDLSAYVPKSQIIKELGGDEDWEYDYVEPLKDENALMNNDTERAQLIETHRKEFENYERLTMEWLHGKDTKAERDELVKKMRQHYWQLDPLVRARSLYDRTGMIGKDGTVDYYPKHTAKPENIPSLNGVPHQEASADDVD